MQEIAQRTGGMFFEAKKKDNLEETFTLIASGLHQQYLLTYTPDRPGDEGEFHKIVLKTTNGDYTVEVREGYYGPPQD
jgi:VWFA-related protein